MPQPMTGPAEPPRGGQHAAAPQPRDDLAMALPAWDLLPPVEFVRRRQAGG